MRADGRVAIFNCDAFASPFRLTSFGTFPEGQARKVKLKLTHAQKEPRKRAALQILTKLNYFLRRFTVVVCLQCGQQALPPPASQPMQPPVLCALMTCLDAKYTQPTIIRPIIHVAIRNTSFYFASMLITVSLSYFLAGRKSRYRNAIRKTTATPVPKLNASPPTNTLPNW